MTDLALTIEQFQGNDEQFWNLMESVPFGNSDFQTQAFVANHVTPGRTRRQILLELHKKAEALLNARCDRDKTEVEIRMKQREIERKRNGPQTEDTEDEIRLLEIEIERKLLGLKSQQKLVKDAIATAKVLLAELKKFPNMTREQFEAEERTYWMTRLVQEGEREMLATGTVSAGKLEALQKTGMNPYEVHTTLQQTVRGAKLALCPPSPSTASRFTTRMVRLFSRLLPQRLSSPKSPLAPASTEGLES